MKLSKTSSLILTIGIFFIAFVGLGIAHSRQASEQNQLGEELYVAEQGLSKLPLQKLRSQKNDLEERLNRTLLQLEAAKNELSQPIKSIDITDSLFEIAGDCRVEISDVNSSVITSDKLEGINGPVIQLLINFEGDLTDIISFITRLNNDFATGVVKSAEIKLPETTAGDKPSANIRLVLYTY